jgi:hypothetical protein
MFTDIFPATFADDLLTNAPLSPEFTVVNGLADPSQPGSYANLLSGANHSFTTGFAAGGSYNSILAANPNFTAPSVFNPDKNIHYPTYEEYSLQIQQQIGRSTSFQIGYVGNHGYSRARSQQWREYVWIRRSACRPRASGIRHSD